MAAQVLKRLQLSGRPTPQDCKAVVDALAQLHGRPNRQQHNAGLQPGCELKEPHTVLDSLVRTILSQNTTDITSQRAYTSLKQAFPTWESVRTAKPGAVEEAIRVGGLADIKARRIKDILESLLLERGELSLEHLRVLPSDDIKQQLIRYKGVGPKSIACVMLFCLGRDEFAVDTHVWEISKQLGWVPEGASRELTYEYLNTVVPDEHKYQLHVLLVEHGKVCPHCFKRSSKAGGKRKGKGGAAAAVVCPLAPLKRGSSKSSSSSSTTKTLDSGTDSSPASEPQLEPAMPLSSNTAEVQAVTVKVEPVDVPRGGIQQQLHVVTIKQEIKQEPDSQQAVQQQSFIDAVVVPRTQRALKRSRKG